MAKKKKELVNNGLENALLNFQPGTPGSGVQLSQWNTLFKNLRWYLLSNNRQLLSQIYVEFGLIATLVDVPVNDALRGGVDIKSEQLDEEDVKKLQIWLKREKILKNVVGQAAKWNRLFGGAGIVTMTDQDFTQPLKVSKITKDSPLMFRAADMWELFSDQQNTIDSSALTVMDTTYAQENGMYSYYGLTLDPSWVMKLKGLEAPSFIRPRLRGWGYSIVESVVRSVNQYLKSNDLTFEVLDEFKLDIFKFDGLAQTLLSPNGEAQIRKRVAIANGQKNYQNAMAMDGKDSYEQKQLSFAGLAEVAREIRMQIASDLRMPLTKVFGISATGFSSGEDDIENYNAMVESDVRADLEQDILRILEMKCQQLFGFVPDDLEVEFKPLRVLSSEQQENVKTQQFNRALQARQAGEMDSKEFKDAANKENWLGVQLDTSRDTLPPISADTDGKEPGEAKAKKSVTQAKDAKS